MLIAASDENMLLAIKFKVKGSLRLISHAEMMRVFQRACVRAVIKMKYSRGFNPRPKMSLPLPRPVGVESDDELLCIHVDCDQNEIQTNNYFQRIMKQLPEGCEVLSVDVYPKKTSFQPFLARYILTVRDEYPKDKLKEAIERVLASDTLNIQRKTGSREPGSRTRGTGIKNIDVRGFLKSIKLNGSSIIVDCNISPEGSIRVEEIMELLELDMDELKAPIMRTNVQWRIKPS